MKSKHIKLLLIAVLALVMAFALVACNGDKKNSDDVEMSEATKQIVEQSRSDFDAMLNYFLTRVEALTAEEQFNTIFYNSGVIDAFDGGYAECSFVIDDDGVNLYVFENEDVAKSIYESEFTDSEDAVRIGNKLIYNYTLYQQIIDTKRPASITKFTKEQIEFMEDKLHRGVGKKEAFSVSSFDVSEDESGSVMWYNAMLNSNCQTFEGIYKANNSEAEEFAIGLLGDEKLRSINYTEDSYIKRDETTGITSYKFTHKPGWHVEEIIDYQTDEPTGKYSATYYYSEVPSTITIPTKVGEYEIEEVRIELEGADNDSNVMQSVVIEKEIHRVYLDGKIKQITIPASDEAFVSISDNTELKTINFGGTTQQWEELYGYSAQNWTHVYDNNEEKYVDISFTVVCTNGNITYPKTNA